MNPFIQRIAGLLLILTAGLTSIWGGLHISRFAPTVAVAGLLALIGSAVLLDLLKVRFVASVLAGLFLMVLLVAHSRRPGTSAPLYPDRLHGVERVLRLAGGVDRLHCIRAAFAQARTSPRGDQRGCGAWRGCGLLADESALPGTCLFGYAARDDAAGCGGPHVDVRSGKSKPELARAIRPAGPA